MTKEGIYEIVARAKTSFISSVDENGYPATRALIAPRLVEGNTIYFATYTSSRKVQHYRSNPKACVYFYERGKRFQGVEIKGTMEVLTDQATKDRFWRPNDTMFYRKGVTDPNYCILKFTGFQAEYFISFKTETVML